MAAQVHYSYFFIKSHSQAFYLLNHYLNDWMSTWNYNGNAKHGSIQINRAFQVRGQWFVFLLLSTLFFEWRRKHHHYFWLIQRKYDCELWANASSFDPCALNWNFQILIGTQFHCAIVSIDTRAHKNGEKTIHWCRTLLI